MFRACAAELMAVDQVELKRCLVVAERITGRMTANDRPLTRSEMVIDMVPQFVITAPRCKSPTRLQSLVAQTERTIPRMNKDVGEGDRSASLRNWGFEMDCAMTLPYLVAEDPLKALLAIANL